ncbi:MAG: hypothetical protein HYV26_00085 [Candidatus Hydrogenedentes bacterium]|nr:hypothetical protein [Candidatus Hydrogenedentota bacterium]
MMFPLNWFGRILRAGVLAWACCVVALGLAGCGLAAQEDPLVWVTPESQTYHTKRCAQVPPGTRMQHQREAATLGLTLCRVCSEPRLPSTAPGQSGENLPSAPLPAEGPAEIDASPEDQAETTEEVPITEAPAETVVYVTQTGAKYHQADCPHLETRVALALGVAMHHGYLPCESCNPPRLAPAPAPATPPAPPRPRTGPRLVIPGR